MPSGGHGCDRGMPAFCWDAGLLGPAESAGSIIATAPSSGAQTPQPLPIAGVYHISTFSYKIENQGKLRQPVAWASTNASKDCHVSGLET